MLTPIKNPFIHKKHLIFYNMNNLYDLLKYYLDNNKEREEIAKNGKEYSLKYHTFVYRVEEIIEEIKTNVIQT
jgi:spore maturation protein CgeB